MQEIKCLNIDQASPVQPQLKPLLKPHPSFMPQYVTALPTYMIFFLQIHGTWSSCSCSHMSLCSSSDTLRHAAQQGTCQWDTTVRERRRTREEKWIYHKFDKHVRSTIRYRSSHAPHVYTKIIHTGTNFYDSRTGFCPLYIIWQSHQRYNSCKHRKCLDNNKNMPKTKKT
jgi:hypothetical protein